LYGFGACYAIITALIYKRYLIFSSESVNSAANSAFGASKWSYLELQKRSWLVFDSSLYGFGACYAIITALISKRYLICSSESVNFAANSAFGASK
jgi:hypothetical protein